MTAYIHMEKFQPGVVCYHKATKLRCVVIKTTNEIVKVRDEKNQEQDYYPQELETAAEIEAKNAAQADEINRANKERGRNLGYDF